jgi:hypothetical protein|tara:strand:+ start:3425 stop:3892 length:468 start_codon:yes stop_codon:yes gene_type:complete
MIDPFTAFAALKGATEAISSAIKTGRDLSTMSSSVAKWAKAEAGLQVITSEKPGVVSKLFGKLTGAEQNAIDAHFRKEEANRLRDEMRSMFLLYGSAGQWERLQQEIAVERKRQANILKEKIRKQKLKKNIIIGVIAGILGLGILTIEFYIITNL